MFSKDELKALKLNFWGSLNETFSEIRGVNGNKVNWTNFNTKLKDLYFRMEADDQGCRLCIDMQFADEGIRTLFYDQFEEFKAILEGHFEALKWHPSFEHSNGKTISRIVLNQEGTNMYNKEDWPQMHDFLTTNFSKLEAFWAEFSEVFVQLKS